MVLGFDIGNTHIVPTFFDEDGQIEASFRIPANLQFTEDTLFVLLNNFAENSGLKIHTVKAVVISSVVPNINDNFVRLGKKYFSVMPEFISLDNIKNEIKLLSETERALGADRIADILAAKKLHPDKDLLVIDFGTATTFDMIQNSTYMGGCILPGIALSINALFLNTARLPKIDFAAPDTVLGVDTVTQINAGIFYGNIGAVKELISQYKKSFPKAYVIATGGQGKQISKHTAEIDEYVMRLAEMGIFEFYRLHKK